MNKAKALANVRKYSAFMKKKIIDYIRLQAANGIFFPDCSEVQAQCFWDFLSLLPADERRDFLIVFYTCPGGGADWRCRRLIRKLPKSGIKELPAEFRKKEITVYRAAKNNTKAAFRAISWSLSLESAEGYLHIPRRPEDMPTVIYRAEIRPQDVIAYCNRYHAMEVMQYKSVKNIEIIETSDNSHKSQITPA